MNQPSNHLLYRWHGQLGILEGSGGKMRHVKLTNLKDIRKKAFQDMVRSAVKLNRERGDPTKPTTK